MTSGTLIALLIVIVAIVVVIALFVTLGGRRLRKLPEQDRVRYAEAWRAVETRFIDGPAAAVRSADQLAVEILRARGARVEDGKAPKELQAAREASRTDQGRGSETEGYRSAMVRYQAIVDDAVGKKTRRSAESNRREIA